MKKKAVQLKSWLLDADVIIDLLSFGIFDSIVNNHKVCVSSVVIEEVKFYKENDCNIPINFRKRYVETDKVNELTADIAEITEFKQKLPVNLRSAIDLGETESLTVLLREKDLFFCTCDSLAIRTLPFLGLSDRGISVEKLINTLSIKKVPLAKRHTEKYFRDVIKDATIEYIQSINLQGKEKSI